MNSFGYISLLFYLVCVIWRPQDYVPFLLGLPFQFGFLMLALLSWFFGQKKLDAPQYKFILGLLFTVLVSNVLAEGIRLGVEQARTFFFDQVLIFVLVANALTTVKRQQWFFAAFVLASTIVSLHTIDQYFDPERMGWTGMPMLARTDFGDEPLYQSRYIGIFNDPNDLGLLLVCALPFIAYLFFNTGNIFARLVLLGAAAAHLISIYMTNSRGTILAVAAVLGSWGILRYGGFKVLLRMIMFAPILPIVVPTRFYLSGDASSNERIYAWYEGTQMFLANPLFGIGQGLFLDYHYRTAHNSWVLVFAELGFVGFYFWVALLFSSLYILWVCQQPFPSEKLDATLEREYERERKLAAAMMFAMIGVLACAFFLSRSYIVLLYILPAMAVAQYHRFRGRFRSIEFIPMALPMLGLSVGFFLLINIVIRLNS